MSEHAVELTSENFEEKTSKGKWIVDFWAEWCGPCKMMGPEFDKAAQELKGKVQFGKVDVDSQTEIAQRFEVMSIPALVLMKNGQEVDRLIGAMPKQSIVDAINKVLK
jgi:thioredoxin 1